MSIQTDDNETRLQSSYLEYLPALFRSDEFLGRFLLIFESILKPIENTVDNMASYFDPLLTPQDLLPWLASWIELVLDPSWPEQRRRELIKSAAELYLWQGTKRGMVEYLRIYTGTLPEVTEHIEGMRLGSEARLGISTKIGSAGGGNHFTVTIDLNDDTTIDIEKIVSIIEAQKPAHTIYTLHVNNNPGTGD
ncbi:MAG: phage tail protein [Chloroflexota bacterium]|nr:phage tail protein [Chloroflexota bacterium]